MSKIVYINIHDHVYSYISGLEPQDQIFLEKFMAVDVPGGRFMPAFKLGRWDGKIRFFEATGKIYTRLLEEVIDYIVNWGYQIEIVDKRKPFKTIDRRIDSEWFLRKSDMPFRVELRPYQVEAINLALECQSGFIEAATGAGKTWMVAGLADLLNQEDLRVLVIVPSSDLVEQTVTTLNFGRLDVGTYSGSRKDYNHMTVVATWQALQNNPTVVKDFQAVVVDEAHGATAKTIGDLINNHGRDNAYRWGFTGTIPKEKIDQYTLRGSIGDVLYRITAADLIRLGYLAEVEIEPIETVVGAEEEFPDYTSERSYLFKSEERLDLIADAVIAKANQYGNTLVLVNSIKQGQQLQRLIRDSIFLQGATDNDVRAEWYSTFETRDDLIVIATSGIASTGISIDRVFCLILIDAGKSFVKCIQSIGRGLRKGRDKDKVHCVDLHSNLKWSKKHWRQRKKYYEEAGYPLLKVKKVKV